jgi:D-alanyl-D-alanine carboxypeptidase/D-alanyl-D-alanine-endopeptidase (penicillin-binding protein 4)
MNYILRLLILLNLCLAALSVEGQTLQSMQGEVRDILAKYKISSEHLGMVISYKDQNVFENNAKKLFIPASISKLLTSYSVLKNIDLTQKFKTELYFDGKNLYLKGTGDPSFVSENLWYLVNEFTRQKIRLIPGDIIVDDFYFDAVRFDSSRESSRVDRSYDAPVGAMSFNWNSINVFVKPAAKENESAQVVLDPENAYFTLVNKTVTKSKKLTRELVINVDQKNRTITVTGDVLKGGIEKAYFKNVADPEQWAGENLKAFLGQRNISVKGRILRGKTPTSAEKIVTFESKSLSMILADMNKFSNNYVAEMLTKNLAALSGESPATLATGVKVIQKDLKDLGLDNNDVRIYNPSGFTRDNMLSAHGMGAVLKAMQNDFRYFPTLLESLPIAGVDGTLKKRMKNSAASGFVRAKTGYLDGVVTLAGYAGQKNGDIYRFAFLYNGPQDEAKVREAFDQVLIYLLR